MGKADKHEQKASRQIDKAKAAAGTGKFWGHMNKAADHNQRAESKRLRGR